MYAKSNKSNRKTTKPTKPERDTRSCQKTPWRMAEGIQAREASRHTRRRREYKRKRRSMTRVAAPCTAQETLRRIKRAHLATSANVDPRHALTCFAVYSDGIDRSATGASSNCLAATSAICQRPAWPVEVVVVRGVFRQKLLSARVVVVRGVFWR